MGAKAKRPSSSDEDAERVVVRIAEPIRLRAKVYATINRRRLQEVLDEAVDEYLRKRGA